jgi:hypothetical protein
VPATAGDCWTTAGHFSAPVSGGDVVALGVRSALVLPHSARLSPPRQALHAVSAANGWLTGVLATPIVTLCNRSEAMTPGEFSVTPEGRQPQHAFPVPGGATSETGAPTSEA